MAQTDLSGDNRIDSILITDQWGTENGNSISLTYSFPTIQSSWKNDYSAKKEPFAPNSIRELNVTQKQNVRDALELWSNVSNLSFSEVKEPLNQGDIRIMYSTVVSGDIAGWAYTPPSSSLYIPGECGDIWLNVETSDLTLGGHGFSTLIHEAGHALGLKHSFEVQANNPEILSVAEDTNRYTVMSYTNYADAGDVYTANNDGSYTYVPVEATTPMLYDILAIQFLYGANTSYNTGDDTYTFSSSSAEFKTVWDAGGDDTFDLSNQTLDMVINLNPGTFSSLGVRSTSYDGPLEAGLENVAIAFNVDIENAAGGRGDDTIIGNALNNFILGGKGDDQINGGAGFDYAVFSSQYSENNISILNGNVTITGPEGSDILEGVERMWFDDYVVASDIDGDAGKAFRLYQAAFDRLPDLKGLGYWIKVIDDGAPLEGIASSFIGSAEFQSLYGSNPSNEAFMELIYANVLNRSLDQAGYDYWIKALDDGFSRAGVLSSFSESQENKVNVLGSIQDGIVYEHWVV